MGLNKAKALVYVTFLAFILFPINSTPLYLLIFENIIKYLSLLPALGLGTALFMVLNCFVMAVFLIWMCPFSFYYWTKAIDEFESLNLLMDRARKHKEIPPIAVVIPAFNEEKTIVQTVLSCQRQTWRPKQIIIVDDGSTDGMIDVLVEKFKLVRRNNLTFPTILKQKGIIEARYSNDDITLISKENAGKSFALNCGFDAVDVGIKHVCVFDADTIAHEEGIMGLIFPMLEDESLVLTSGKNNVINDCKVINGEVVETGITTSPLILSQIKEYMNDLMNKAFENSIGAQTVLVGNFSAYRLDVVYVVGGFDDRGLTEDYDYNFGIHTMSASLRNDWKMRSIFTAQAWTQVPHSFSGIFNQRIRWGGGMLDTLIRGWNKPLKKPIKTLTWFQKFRAIIFPVLTFGNFLFIPMVIYLCFTPESYLVKELFLYFYIPAFCVKFVLEAVLHSYVDWKYLRSYEKLSTYVLLAFSKMVFGYGYNSILIACNSIAYWRLFKGTGKWGKMERVKVD